TSEGYLQAASILDRVVTSIGTTRSSVTASGAQIVYLFLGNAYLLLADSVFDETQDLAAATEYSNRAKVLLESGLEQNPSYARLHLALAEVLFGQASSYDRPQCVENWAESAADIESRYQAALEHLSDDPILQSGGVSSARWLQLAAELGLA